MPNISVELSGESSKHEEKLLPASKRVVRPKLFLALAGLLCLLLGTPASQAHENPPGCTGSALGINLFTDIANVHIGDTIRYSATVFNGLPGSPRVACDATGILAGIVTPDGLTNMFTLRRTTLLNGENDFYTNVVSYVVRTQDVQPDGTVRATAFDNGTIHQNDTDSRGGGNQGVNTEVNLPCIRISVQCTGSVGQNGLIQFTGTVLNCGNDTLVGVTVTNFVNNAQFAVLFPTTLLKGQSATFSGSWIPSNACIPSTATFVARGNDQFAIIPRTATSSASTTCSNVLTPNIAVTQTCLTNAASSGGVLTYSGFVQNTGNVTLTNVVVINDRSGTTPVFTVATLAPGVVASFTGSYTIPAEAGCSSTSTLTASGNDQCAGTRVTANASATCPLLARPAIKVTQACPPTATVQGGTLTFTGSVQNTGNITLTNVVVFNDRSGTTPVFTAATLAPGVVANFTGSYTVPFNCCTSSSTVTAKANDLFTGAAVTDKSTSTCLVLTTPKIVVTKVCPTTSLEAGDLLKYSGIVSNAGNITLVRVIVLNNQSNAALLGPITLAPGESVSYAASYVVPPDFCGTDIVTARGFNACTDAAVSDSVTTTCPSVSAPRIAVTQNCPQSPTPHGGVFNYTGTVSNPGNVTLTNVVVVNSLSTNNTPVIGPITLAPGASVSFTGSSTAPLICCEMTDTLTARGQDRCSGATVTATASTACPLLYTQRISVTQICPVTPPSIGDLYVFNGAVSNPGDTILTNVFVFSDQPGNRTPLLGPIELAPGESKTYTGSFVVPLNTCAINVTATGANLCSSNVVTNIVNCPIGISPGITVAQTCPTIPVSPGGLVTYGGSVRNTGNVTLSNVIVSDNQSAPVTAGLVGYWALDEAGGSVAIDSSGNGNNGNIVNANRVAGELGGALNLNGSSSSIDIANSTALNFSGVITMAAWVKVQSSSGLQDILAHGYSTSPNAGVFLRINNGRYEVGSWNGAVASTASDVVPVGDIGNFVHLAGVYDGTAWTLYRNGVALNATTSSLGSLTVNANWAIGSRGGAAERFFNGVIDEVRLYQRALSSAEIVALAGPVGSTTIFTVASLAPGAIANFTGSFIAPLDCLAPTTLSVRAASLCGTPVTNTVSSTCPLITTPSLTVTRICPPNPVAPGGVLVYGGSIRNTGNITVTNITVVSSQPVPNTTVFILASLAPGATASFNSSFNAPLDACSVTSTLIVTGRDSCTGSTVTANETSACPLVLSPQITVTKNCPPASITPGTTLVYTGTVTNTGNITLTNVFVVNSQPVPNTPVFGPVTLAPGAGATFTGSYIVPPNICSITGTVTATGQDRCAGATVTDSFTATCLVSTTSRLAITQVCPPNLVASGAPLTYSGTIRNTGDTTLTNIVVTSDRTGAAVVFALATLAPGSSASFNGSYTVPANSGCSISSTLTARGNDATTTCGGTLVVATATAICPLVGTPALEVTQICPITPVASGAILTYAGTVRNVGNITLVNVVVVNDRTGATPIFTLASLPPGTVAAFTGSYTVPANSGCSITSTLTVTGNGQCAGTPAVANVTAVCPLLTSPGLTVTRACPTTPVAPGGVLVYTGTVRNTGSVTLTDITVSSSRPAPSATVFAVASLAPGASATFSGSYNAPLDACSVTSTLVATGRDLCTGNTATGSDTTSCPLVASPSITVTKSCPPTSVTPGATLSYTGTVVNSGNVTLTNVFVLNNQPVPNTLVIGPITLAPGASANFTGSYIIPANICSITGTVTATGQDRCTATTVANSFTATCLVFTSSSLSVTQVCPLIPVTLGGLLTYTGTVRNTGDTTVTNIVVTSDRTGATAVFTAASLPPGGSASFTGSYTVPVNSGCSITSTLTAAGNDSTGACGGTLVTATITTTCTLTTAPAIEVTQACPVTSVVPGSILTYTGTVRNTGNIALTNIVVINDRSGATPVFTLASLPVGVVASFTGSYTAPASASATSTSTATANSLCGASVSNSAISTCPLVSPAAIAVTKACPPLSVAAGATLTYTGTVTNSGGVTLTNVFVVDNQPVANTPVLGPITLAPGAGTNFTGSYTVPLNACSTADTLIASGNNAVTGVTVTSTISATCVVNITPGIAVTENCPVSPVPAGSAFAFNGTVSNTGNVTLTNVLVKSSQPVPNTLVLGPITLAPGASANYTGSFVVPSITKPFTSIGPATLGTVSPPFGPLPTGTVTDRFVIGTNFNGLMFADQDVNWGPTLLYAIRHEATPASTFTSISTISPNVGVVANRFNLTATNYNALTLAAPDVGFGSVNFYYIRNDSAGVSTLGVIKPAGASSSSDLKVVGSGLNALTFSATDAGYGANLFYYLRTNVSGLSTFGTIVPALLGATTDRFIVGTNFDALVYTPTDVGYGVQLFYYLRHNAAGLTTFGTIDARSSFIGPDANRVVDRFVVGTNVHGLAFTATDAGYGPNNFYFLRAPVVVTTNAVVNTVTATGIDICLAGTVTASANCSGSFLQSITPGGGSETAGRVSLQSFHGSPTADGKYLESVVGSDARVIQSGRPEIGRITIVRDRVMISWSSVPGVTYTLQYASTIANPVWMDIPGNITGTGATASMEDHFASGEQRLYRVKAVQE